MTTRGLLGLSRCDLPGAAGGRRRPRPMSNEEVVLRSVMPHSTVHHWDDRYSKTPSPPDSRCPTFAGGSLWPLIGLSRMHPPHSSSACVRIADTTRAGFENTPRHGMLPRRRYDRHNTIDCLVRWKGHSGRGRFGQSLVSQDSRHFVAQISPPHAILPETTYFGGQSGRNVAGLAGQRGAHARGSVHSFRRQPRLGTLRRLVPPRARLTWETPGICLTARARASGTGQFDRFETHHLDLAKLAHAGKPGPSGHSTCLTSGMSRY